MQDINGGVWGFVARGARYVYKAAKKVLTSKKTLAAEVVYETSNTLSPDQ